MGKHLKAKIKYNYVKRYRKGEKLYMLAIEMIENNHTNTQQMKYASMNILAWNRKYSKSGIQALESKTGAKATGRKKKPKKPKYEDMTKEELIKEIKIINYVNEIYKKEIDKNTRARFKYKYVSEIAQKFCLSIKKSTAILQVSKSGYYQWLKNPKTTDNYDEETLDKISKEFTKWKGICGFNKLWNIMKVEDRISVCLSTFYRYYKFLSLESKIRKAKKSREIKAKEIGKNIVKRNFNSPMSRKILSTDVTQYRIGSRSYYISAVIDCSNNELVDIVASPRNNAALVANNIEKSLKSLGTKTILHSDNAAYYRGEEIYKILKKYKSISSFSRKGNSLDNRPVEYFFSILKHEYLKQNPTKSFVELKQMLENIKYHYNFVRKQGNLQWKTPAMCRS